MSANYSMHQIRFFFESTNKIASYVSFVIHTLVVKLDELFSSFRRLRHFESKFLKNDEQKIEFNFLIIAFGVGILTALILFDNFSF